MRGSGSQVLRGSRPCLAPLLQPFMHLQAPLLPLLQPHCAAAERRALLPLPLPLLLHVPGLLTGVAGAWAAGAAMRVRVRRPLSLST